MTLIIFDLNDIWINPFYHPTFSNSWYFMFEPFTDAASAATAIKAANFDISSNEEILNPNAAVLSFFSKALATILRLNNIFQEVAKPLNKQFLLYVFINVYGMVEGKLFVIIS